VLVLRTKDGLSALDARSGRVTSLIAAAVPEPDWSHVYTTTSSAGETTITRIEISTGDRVSSTTVPGDLQIRAVAPFGLGVALMPRGTSGQDPWVPRSRARTHIVVADPSGVSAPLRFNLKGNYEPEAFSPDGERLYMLQYRPALAPTSYRVIGLYLETGKRWALIGPNKQPVENMTATRLAQVPSPDGSYLYTLYTNQRPAYLGEAATATDHAAEKAFIHTVDLTNGFAVCIKLPRNFGTVPQQASAIAISPNGHRVYAVDAQHGVISIVNTQRYRVVGTAHVDLGALGGGHVDARVSADGSTLFITGNAGLLRVDATTLELRGSLIPTPGPVTGLALSSDGSSLYLSWGDEVQALDATTLEPTQTLRLTSTAAVEFVGTSVP
jgi:hypothetical protein